MRGGNLLADTIETGDASWISTDALGSLPLSTDRVTLSQLETVLAAAVIPHVGSICD